MEIRHHEEAIHPYTCRHGTEPTVISILFWVSPEVPMQKKSSQLTVSSLENTIQVRTIIIMLSVKKSIQSEASISYQPFLKKTTIGG